ncbi:MAG: hypothetical protein AAF329_24060, partial [Cyanobacteria bacterium P01_A01_bin.17]
PEMHFAMQQKDMQSLPSETGIQHGDMKSKMQPHAQMEGMSPEVHQMHQQLKAQLKLKLTPGIQEGELPGSFMDAMMKLMPNMQMSHDGMKPGKINPAMIDAMLKGWEQKYGNLPDVEMMPMDVEPSGISLAD